MAIVATVAVLLCGRIEFVSQRCAAQDSRPPVTDQLTSKLVAPIGGDNQRHSANSSVQRRPRAQISQISQQIDALVTKQLSLQNLTRNPVASDEVFLRRVYLQIAGRIPTMAESHDFLHAKNQSKRADLTDRLLDSDAYVSHQFNFWADLLRIKERLMGGVSGEPYKDFVKDAVAQNMPYDEMVRALITSSGPAYERGNGATGYYLRDMGMPEDNMSNTVRVFLGTRLECAQCHDHPFDSWTQKEYFQMVAFTGGVRTRLEERNSDVARETRQLAQEETLSADERRRIRKLLQPLNVGVIGSGTGLARLPEDYQYDDGEPFEIVTAKPMFDSPHIEIHPQPPSSLGENQQVKKKRQHQIRGADEINSRETYAQWLTSPENPRFSNVIANRLWKYAFGIGLIEPVDDMTEDSLASNPALMDYLTHQIVALDFDVKQFLRAIYLTDTFQREATLTDIDVAKPYYFPGPLMRRMTAEQLWDSLVTMTVPEVDQRENTLAPKGLYNGRLASGDIYSAFDMLRTLSPEQIVDLASQGRRGEMLNDQQMNDADREFRGTRDDIRQRQRELRKQIAQARRTNQSLDLQQLEAEMRVLMDEAREAFAYRDFVRASELSSPMKPGHFLREFGQSDREQIDNANDDPAVTQVLALMNGVLEDRIVNNAHSMLMKNVSEAETPQDRLNATYLTILSRYPTRRESRTWKDHIDDGGQGRDVIWVLANTHEFMFIP